MTNNMQALSILKQDEWRVIDQIKLGKTFEAQQSFAIDDTLCTVVGQNKSSAVVRAWVHTNTIVLGIQDTKLPYIQDGIHFLKEKGYRVIIRNSGGLAVVLDNDILNISLILTESKQKIDIHSGYDAMWELIKLMLKSFPVKIEAKEIQGSYCPGSYDLSIENRKFAGISQRRVRGGVAIQIYLCVGGSGSERASLLKQFYDYALKDEQTNIRYPNIEPKTMASLSELLHVKITVADLMNLLKQSLEQLGCSLVNSQLNHMEELELYHENYKRLLDRNKKWLVLN